MQVNRLVTSRLSESMSSSELKEVPQYFLTNGSHRSIAAGQNTTLLLAKPTEKFSDMPRHPEDVNPPTACVGCNKDYGEDDSPLECDKVRSYNNFAGTSLTHLPSSVMLLGICSVSTHLSMRSLTANGSAPTARKTLVPVWAPGQRRSPSPSRKNRISARQVPHQRMTMRRRIAGSEKRQRKELVRFFSVVD